MHSIPSCHFSLKIRHPPCEGVPQPRPRQTIACQSLLVALHHTSCPDALAKWLCDLLLFCYVATPLLKTQLWCSESGGASRVRRKKESSFGVTWVDSRSPFLSASRCDLLPGGIQKHLRSQLNICGPGVSQRSQIPGQDPTPGTAEASNLIIVTLAYPACGSSREDIALDCFVLKI